MIFLPDPNHQSEAQMWCWYESITEATSRSNLSAQEQQLFDDYYREAGLTRPWRQQYFRQHFCRNFFEIADFITAGRTRPLILDLGCGTGTQALYLALLGAHVVALDLDRNALEVLRKRKDYYERETNSSLHLEIIEGDALSVDLSQFGRFDAIYSLFAFNMMQPSSALLRRLTSWMESGSRLALLDGNSTSWLARLWPSRRRTAWSAEEAADQLRNAGYTIIRHRGGVAIPPVIWQASEAFASTADAALVRYFSLSISHLLLASYDSGCESPVGRVDV